MCFTQVNPVATQTLIISSLRASSKPFLVGFWKLHGSFCIGYFLYIYLKCFPLCRSPFQKEAPLSHPPPPVSRRVLLHAPLLHCTQFKTQPWPPDISGLFRKSQQPQPDSRLPDKVHGRQEQAASGLPCGNIVQDGAGGLASKLGSVGFKRKEVDSGEKGVSTKQNKWDLSFYCLFIMLKAGCQSHWRGMKWGLKGAVAGKTRVSPETYSG